MKIKKNVLLVANWKMNPKTLQEAKKRFEDIKKNSLKYKDLSLVVCPPFPFISSLGDTQAGSQKSKSKVLLGSQDVSIFEEGLSKTGEVGAVMVKSSGADYAIIGHSERRQMGDAGQTIAVKVQQALKAGLDVILCVGEKDRDTDGGYFEVIKTQIKEALVGVGRPDFHRIVIAYEPVWAIGRKDNLALTSYDLHQMVVYIRKFLRDSLGETISSMTKILYGGSVTADNAEDIIWNGEVDGLLIGRASWEAASFDDICRAIVGSEKVQDKKDLKKKIITAKNNRIQARLGSGNSNVVSKNVAALNNKRVVTKPAKKSASKKVVSTKKKPISKKALKGKVKSSQKPTSKSLSKKSKNIAKRK
jgi:triosephosphate isomerase (TIM)